MKIYNGKYFVMGLLLTLLGAALLAVELWKGFDVKGTAIMVLCLFFGVGVMLRSMSRERSREDKVAERDERNRCVTVRARSAAFLWSQGCCFLLLLLSLLGRGLLGEVLSTSLSLAFGGMLGAMFLLELFTLLYYDRRM